MWIDDGWMMRFYQLLSVNVTIHIHKPIVHEEYSHVCVEGRKCVEGRVSQDDAVGMLWHLR